MRTKSYRFLIVLLLVVSAFGQSLSVFALTTAERLSGRILLQVQSSGEGWYVHPKELQRYYLGTPDNAYSVMRTTGLGITDKDLLRIAIGGGVGDGDLTLERRLSGRILLQVQSHGEAWYVNPLDLKRYYLGRPADAFALMRGFGLGITNADLATIPISPFSTTPQVVPSPVVVTPAPAPSPTPAPQPVATPLNDGHDAVRNTIFIDLNKKRVASGIPQVSLSSQLSLAAQAHADDMTAKGYFSFNSPGGGTLEDRLKAAGYEAWETGMWMGQVPSGASGVLSAWTSHSAQDFANTGLGQDFLEMGIGVGRVDGQPTFVIVMATSQADHFKTETAPLSDLNAIRQAILDRVNLERAKEGLVALTMNDKLTKAAQIHTDDMLAQAYFSHAGLDGSTPGDRVTLAGYRFRETGENIAKNQTSVEEVMDGWMASPGHRENIMHPNYRELGVGLSFGKNKNGYEILWGQEFGLAR